MTLSMPFEERRADLPATSLRERKKLHTRRSLIAASHRLFLEQGFAATTLEQIAAEVDVHVTTLLRYFPTKQELALALERQALERFRELVAASDRSEPVVETYLGFVARMAEGWGRDRMWPRYLQFLTSDPAILAYAMTLTQQYEDLLADRLAEEFRDHSGPDWYPRIHAAMVAASVSALVRMWQAAPREFDLVAALTGLRGVLLSPLGEGIPAGRGDWSPGPSRQGAPLGGPTEVT